MNKVDILGTASVACFAREGHPGERVQLERAGRELRTLEFLGDQHQVEKREHFIDTYCARAQFKERARLLVEQGYTPAEDLDPSNLGLSNLGLSNLGPSRGGRSGAAFVCVAGLIWTFGCFFYGLPGLESTPEAAVAVFFAAPAAVVPTLLGAMLGAGFARWCNAANALAILGVVGWSMVVHPRLGPSQVGALAVFAFCLSLLVTYAVLILVTARGMRSRPAGGALTARET